MVDEGEAGSFTFEVVKSVSVEIIVNGPDAARMGSTLLDPVVSTAG
jgi:hypothetical protein